MNELKKYGLVEAKLLNNNSIWEILIKKSLKQEIELDKG